MTAGAPLAAQAGPGERASTLRAVTAIMGAVVGLSFLFGFGNVWALGVRLGVPAYVAPLVAPAVDLSVVGLLLGTRFLAVHGASREQLRPARRLLMFASLVTLALNAAEPVLAGQYGKAAFDSVGSCLLIGWAHVGPSLVQAMSEAGGAAAPAPADRSLVAPGAVGSVATAEAGGDTGAAGPVPVPEPQRGGGPLQAGERGRDDDLLERARAEDARHWELHRRPISAEVLRKRLRIGTTRARSLVAQLRADTDSGIGRASPTPDIGAATAVGAPG